METNDAQLIGCAAADLDLIIHDVTTPGSSCLSRPSPSTITPFTPETQAAWYALSPFINPLDCSQRFSFEDENGKLKTLVVPLNYNDDLNMFFNGEMIKGQKFKPSWFSKRRLQAHLQRREVYYYRSRYNGVARIGFGSSDNAKDRLGFDTAAFGITGKVRKYPYVGVMLLCADIDCHNGEKDARRVADWLLTDHFPGAYCEPSTNGKGIHLYIKLAYNPWDCRYRHATLEHIVRTIGDFGHWLDRERQRLGFDAPVDGLRGLPSLFITQGDRVRIRRSQCIKVPICSSGIEDVFSFHISPFFLFGALETRLIDAKERQNLSPKTTSLPPDDLVNALLDVGLAPGSPRNSRGRGVSLNSVYPSYTVLLKQLKAESDAFDRSLGFILAYSRHLRRVPSLEEAMMEYTKRHLNTGEDEDGSRRDRFEYLIQHVAKTFDAALLRFNYDGFEADRQATVAEIRGAMHSDVSLEYAKAKGRKSRITVAELAVVLFAMRRSQGSRAHTAFSYMQVIGALGQIRGIGCGRSHASCVLRALRQMGFITKAGGYSVGLEGQRWRVRGRESG